MKSQAGKGDADRTADWKARRENHDRIFRKHKDGAHQHNGSDKGISKEGAEDDKGK